ncbi:heavy-metal-associated domain-containing protein [Dermabacteraceae bacterium TAE3-ERU27]|nr:heavy-metal-associated domain-containing protein [Dermabacteraceae bacterium TAE3-ERU27]
MTPEGKLVETNYLVTGLTCQHCVNAVTSELSDVPGVESVSIDLVAGGASRVTVTAAQPLDFAAVQAAVAEASDNYTVTEA